jgi:hypothetical protein
MTVLFNREDFNSFTDKIRESIKAEINTCEKEYIMKIDTEEYSDFLVSKYSLEEIKMFFENKELLEPIETEIMGKDLFNQPTMVSATQYTLIFPFEGDPNYLFLIPNPRYSVRDIEGRIIENELHIIFIISDYSHTIIERNLERELNKILKYVEYHITELNNNIDQFNRTLDGFIKNWILKRKEKLSKVMSVINVLNIPIRPRNRPTTPFKFPVTKKKLKLKRPKVPETDLKFWVLDYEIYENILEICFNMSTVMERTPETYKNMPEESIRDLFLAHLNGHFEGGVSGETFNKMGKTDILIQVKNDIIFIAECKFWKGEKILLKTIDQLFGYITWRETKTSILIFNKDIKIMTVLNKLDDIMKNHNNYISEYNIKSEKLKKQGVFGYIFKHPDDENINIFLTVLIFNFNISK